MTNAIGETTTNTYDSLTGNLLTVTGAVSGAQTRTYNGYGRVESVTDSDGYWSHNQIGSLVSSSSLVVIFP